MSTFTLSDLEAIIAARTSDDAEKSYTASLLAKGTEKCAKKFGEEAVEAIIAAVSGNRDELVAESADVLYHLLVMLRSENVRLDQVLEELKLRTSQSGHGRKSLSQRVILVLDKKEYRILAHRRSLLR